MNLKVMIRNKVKESEVLWNVYEILSVAKKIIIILTLQIIPLLILRLVLDGDVVMSNIIVIGVMAVTTHYFFSICIYPRIPNIQFDFFHFKLFAVSCSVIFLLVFTFSALLDFSIVSIAITLVLLVFWGNLNYYLLKFRGTPLFWNDLKSLRLAAKVSHNYSYKMDRVQVWNNMWYLLTAILLVPLCRQIVFEAKVLAVCSTFLIGYCLIKYKIIIKVLDVIPNYWNHEHGIVCNTLMQAEDSYIRKPIDYEKNITKIGSMRSEKKLMEDLPNILVIMNESLCDLQQFYQFDTEKEVFPHIKNDIERIKSGVLHVSPWGGHTANTEFEFLTEESMLFLNNGTVPFQTCIKNRKIGSAISKVRRLGYYSIFAHPFHASGWAREIVYKNLGTNESHFVTDYAEAREDEYMDDLSNYKQVYKWIEQHEQPVFCFNVTMQNHGGYEGGANVTGSVIS